MMTKCNEIGCPNVRYDSLLERDVCDDKWPRPKGCPLDNEDTVPQESKVVQKLDHYKNAHRVDCSCQRKNF